MSCLVPAGTRNKDYSEFHAKVGKSDSDPWSRNIPLVHIEIGFDDEHNCLELQERHV